MHPKGVPCRKWGVKCSNDQEKYGRKATCHPERNASGVEGSSQVSKKCFGCVILSETPVESKDPVIL